MLRVLSVFGTRPEAIKMAPVVLELQKNSHRIHSRTCVTGQHREMLDQVLSLFEVVPDIDLDLMRHNQTLASLTARVIENMNHVFESEQPDIVLVQGDTTTVMSVALAAFYQRIPVGHVEAGLRSHDRYSPFPEEINRRLASVLTTHHFAPTESARQALLDESTPDEQIIVTGNTVIDALKMIIQRPAPVRAQDLLAQVRRLSNGVEPRIVLVTAHRRENFGEPLEDICYGLKELVHRNEDLIILYPVHLNPNVREPVYRILGDTHRVILTNPVEYDTMAHLLYAAWLVLTDSGGIQEEAPALGKPVLVMRSETERPEAIEAGTAILVGSDCTRIVAETERLLHDAQAYSNMASAVSPYGDGHAAKRIVSYLMETFSRTPVA